LTFLIICCLKEGEGSGLQYYTIYSHISTQSTLTKPGLSSKNTQAGCDHCHPQTGVSHCQPSLGGAICRTPTGTYYTRWSPFSWEVVF